jgi:hypothetical protein
VKRALRWLFPTVFYGALVAFLFLYLRTLDFESLVRIHFEWIFLAVAVVLGLCNRYWMVVIWLTILRKLGAASFRRDIGDLSLIYAKSWLGRYIPGTAPWILGKIYFASKHGLSKSKLAVSSFLEGGLQILILLLVGLLMLVVDSRTSLIDPTYKWLMALIALCGFVVLWPQVFSRLMAIAFRLIRKREIPRADLPTVSTVATGAGLYVVSAILGGVSMFFVAKSVWPELPYSELLFCIGATNLASAVSMLAVFAPSGIGVREAILVVLLDIVMPLEIAVTATVLLRVWSIGVDLLFLAVAALTRQALNGVADPSR